MRTAKKLLNFNARKSLYFSFFHSHLIYGIHVWSCTNSSFYNTLAKKQKNAIRIVFDSKYNAHTEPLFKKSEILPLNNLIIFFKLQFMQRFCQNMLPVSFNDTWSVNSIRQQGQSHIVLRSSNNIDIPFARLSSTMNQPLSQFPRLWDEFDDENIKFIRNKPEFNSKLKKIFH